MNGGTFRPTSFKIPDGCLLAAYLSGPGRRLSRAGRAACSTSSSARWRRRSPQRTPAASFGTDRRVDGRAAASATGRLFRGGLPLSRRLRRALDGGDGLVHGEPPQSHGELHVDRDSPSTATRCASSISRCARIPAARAGIRGGCGTTYSFSRALRLLVSVLGDRADHAPFGVAGGGRRPRRTRSSSSQTATHELVAADAQQAREAAPAQGRPDPRRLARRRRLRRSARRAISESSSTISTSATSARATAERAYGAVIAEAVEVGGRPRYRLDAAASAERRKSLRTKSQRKSKSTMERT